MTGRAVGYKEIISAPDAVAVLAEELRAQTKSSHARQWRSECPGSQRSEH